MPPLQDEFAVTLPALQVEFAVTLPPLQVEFAVTLLRFRMPAGRAAAARWSFVAE